MNKCPNCGHEWPDESRAKGGRNKWAGMTKAERSAEMSRIRKKGIKSAKARKRQPQKHNTEISGGEARSATQKRIENGN